MATVDQALATRLSSLRDWLVTAAAPLWWRAGADRVHGGFCERLDQRAQAIAEPRRARVQPRQVYALAGAVDLGWSGDAGAVVRHGLDFFIRHYRRDDGLFRTLAGFDGAMLDDRVVLYDQAFALLGLAVGHRVLGGRYRALALEVMTALKARFKHPEWGFFEDEDGALPLLANPHMHLLEAMLEWEAIDDSPDWRRIADEIADLAFTRLIDPEICAVRETFDQDWRRGLGIEPGHQFEWAWLLLRHNRARGNKPSPAALRLIALGEEHGVDRRRGVALDRLGDGLARIDDSARLWPQTERLKAALSAFSLNNDPGHAKAAVEAADALLGYLATPVAGLWFDRMDSDGGYQPEPAPASSFYHIVAAIAEFARVVAIREAP